MFKLIHWDGALTDLRVAGLLLLSLATVILIARVVAMRGEEADKLARLPLDD